MGLSTLRPILEREYASMESFHSIDPLLFEAREILFNRV
jgi:hypothetical protein